MIFRKFRRSNEINPFPVSDRVVFRSGEEKLTLDVRADAAQMVIGLNRAQARLSALREDTDEEEKKETALFFAGAIFGSEQAERLLQFYGGDPLAVLTACGMYFRNRLSGIITKAQKKAIR